VWTQRSAGSPAGRAAGPALAAFNRLVEAHQACLFNVAYRLLGGAGPAAEAVERAVAVAYRQGEQDAAGARERLLRGVVAACRARGADVPSPPAEGDGWQKRLSALPFESRLAVALVDVAGLNYAQAAAVLDWAPKQVRAQLAAARQAMLFGQRENQ
jgi:DNA-directed RNA polymerase specialized sigma24 family protein